MLLGLALNVVQVTLDFFHARHAMDDEIRALMEISHSPASQIAYNIDARLAEELLDGLVKHPAIVDARIVDPEDRTLAAASRNSPESRYRWLSDLLFEPSQFYAVNLRVPQLAEIPLGELAITIDTYHYGTEFLNRAGYTVVSGFVKSLALSIMLLFVFYFLLTKPMLKVIEALSEVEPEAPEKARLPVPHSHEHDEIGQMVAIINQHLDTIDSSLDQLRDAQSTMKNYSGKLEKEVEDRTREISDKNDALQRGNRALIRAKEDAVRRARSRANFLASMSHEIRTPLNGVLGMLSLALEGELDPGQKNRLEIAQNAGQSLLGLLNDILDISKVEAGKLNLETIPFKLRELVEECATLHAQQARLKNIHLVTDIDSALPEVFLGDPTRTRQIINNLMGNAIKFTNQGEVRIQARQIGGNARIDIIDTGIGMSDDGMRRIFTPFSQADTDTTRRYGGTGLGLTLCRQLVERMHGQIMVESEERRGTHFTVLLPLPVHQTDDSSFQMPEQVIRSGAVLMIPHGNPHRLPLERQLAAWNICIHDAAIEVAEGSPQDSQPILFVDPNDPGARSKAKRWPAQHVIQLEEISKEHSQDTWLSLALPLRRNELYRCLCTAVGEPIPQREAEPETGDITHALHLLLVEDNRVNQIVASGILKKLGYTVDLAENGERALGALGKAHYDMVLMDCQMPVMDGYEATRRIRCNPDWQHIPIIAVTANVMQGDKDDCISAGMNDYITKPYDKRDLKTVIERWSHRRPQDSEADS
ncbi:hybrid sensor histidine kinase/response regulator [Marinobacter caseinilyticus]|uniref:hybrid sensor histidine kinase/response regulator n=1 Tax=Marinobacter caseinilyticus TaxID=2692195 RepID=UPI00140D7FBC|nr:ATP-binding protein [Marinobacter caseinilyticus]